MKINYKTYASDKKYTQMNFTNYELILMCHLGAAYYPQAKRWAPLLVKKVLLTHIKQIDFTNSHDKKATVIRSFRSFLHNKSEINKIVEKYENDRS